MHTTLPKHEIVLLGAGHTNSHILRMWKMQPIPDTRLTCVSNFPVATYSGMLPGVLAELYPVARMEIDLVRFCAAANARLICSDFTGLDCDQRQLLFDDRPPLPFDVLSIGIGSRPRQDGVEADETLVAIKPMQTFIARLESRVLQLVQQDNIPALNVVVVGSGVAGVEVTFCLPSRIKRLAGETPIELTLASADTQLARGTTSKTQKLARREFEARGVNLRLGKRVAKVADRMVVFEDGESIPADITLWATGATAPPSLNDLELPKDDNGFLLTHDTLKTTAAAPIFAVGDAGTIEGSNSPKAGVFAVRQGPILWENIARQLAGRPLLKYEPQHDFLKLMNLGDGRAIAEYKGFATLGTLPWKLKDRIDSRFMDKYQDYTPRAMLPQSDNVADTPMRCAGCGGKVSGSVLSHVLKRLDIPQNEHVLLGLDAPDDAAIIRPVDGRPMTVTADFFAAPLDDAYLSGRLAALNAASDLFALGAKPIAALALATLPLGEPRQQEQLLYEMLAGSLHEFRQMDASLVGGHTIEGPQVTIGFTMLADQGPGEARTKARLRAGDVLILTKPLGTGVLLAAHMQANCRAAWMTTLLESMLLSNQPAASLIDEFDIAALTDVTGFGLAGHLLEMLNASDLACELSLDELPLLPGVADLIHGGVESTLAPANRAAEIHIEVPENLKSSAPYQVLFDPQTSGGLLLAVRKDNVDAILHRLSEQSGVASAVIGVVCETAPDARRIRLASQVD